MSDTVTIPTPHVNHLGPNDTVASAYRDAAHRLRHGYPAGGSNTRESIARTLEFIADQLEAQEQAARDAELDRRAAIARSAFGYSADGWDLACESSKQPWQAAIRALDADTAERGDHA